MVACCSLSSVCAGHCGPCGSVSAGLWQRIIGRILGNCPSISPKAGTRSPTSRASFSRQSLPSRSTLHAGAATQIETHDMSLRPTLLRGVG
jgi:hypothetical protein